MNMKIDKKGLRTILQNFYNKHDEMGETRIEFRKELAGYTNQEYETVRTYKVTKKKMLGQVFTYEREVEKEEIRTILNQVFENEGIIFEVFDYDIDINYVTTGYGLGEHTEAKRVFKGIEANVDYINEFQIKGTEYVR